MAEIQVTWYGDKLIKKIEGVTEDGLYAGAEELLGAAEAKAPERTGKLRESGYVATSGRSTYRKRKIHRKEVKPPAGVALAGFAAFYAHMVERGTSKMSARPFLRPALDSFRERVGKKIVARMSGGLK